MAVSSETSRTPASMIRPRTPCATSDVPSSSPNMPSVESEVHGHHQHVARLADLDRRVDHQVVARLATDRDRRPRDLGGGINRPHVRLHQAGAALRFVDGGDAHFAQYLDGFRIRARDATNDLMFHEIYDTSAVGLVTAMRRTSAGLKPASSIFCANIANPSATGGLMVWPRSVERITRSGPTRRTLSK